MSSRTAIFCKSFEEDFPRLAQLLESHQQFCSEMPFVLSIPSSHAAALKRVMSPASTVHLIFDEDYADFHKVSHYGWYQQQVCKLSVHHTKIADAYLSVDSDAYFIRQVNENDFFHESRMRVVYGSLFTKYEAGNQGLLDFILNAEASVPSPPTSGSLDHFSVEFQRLKAWIKESGGRPPIDRGSWINRLFSVPSGTCLQPGQVLHAPLLARMEAFFADLGLEIEDVIELIPWEYNWYGSWATAAATEEVERSISPIVHFASQAAVDHAKAAGVTIEKLKFKFKIVQMAARHFDTMVF